LEECLDIQGFTNFTIAGRRREVLSRELVAKILSLPLERRIVFFQSLAKIHDHR